jgi:hypothetical protein
LPRIYDGGLAAGFPVVVFLLGPLLMLVEMWIGLAVIVSFFSGDLRDVCLLDVVCRLGVVSVRRGFYVSGGVAIFLRNAGSLCVKNLSCGSLFHPQSSPGFLLGVRFGGGGRMWRGVGCISAPG